MSNICINHSGCVCSDESLVEESRTFESRLQSLLHDTIQESESSMEVQASSHSPCYDAKKAAWCDFMLLPDLCLMIIEKTPSFVFALDAERVDVAARRPELLQRPLLNQSSRSAYVWYSAASVWMRCQTTWGFFFNNVNTLINCWHIFAEWD